MFELVGLIGVSCRIDIRDHEMDIRLLKYCEIFWESEFECLLNIIIRAFIAELIIIIADIIIIAFTIEIMEFLAKIIIITDTVMEFRVNAIFSFFSRILILFLLILILFNMI